MVQLSVFVQLSGGGMVQSFWSHLQKHQGGLVILVPERDYGG